MGSLQLNRIVMRFVFFIPLAMIALFESTVGNDQKQTWMKNWLRGNDEGAEDYPESRDPEVDDDEDGLKISKVPFSELVKVFPNTAQVRHSCPFRGKGRRTDGGDCSRARR